MIITIKIDNLNKIEKIELNCFKNSISYIFTVYKSALSKKQYNYAEKMGKVKTTSILRQFRI